MRKKQRLAKWIKIKKILQSNYMLSKKTHFKIYIYFFISIGLREQLVLAYMNKLFNGDF